ncbi:MAG TPA: hypothetical protein VEC17_03320 [Candidatus Binatia bacterium]|nr:hypothetical protein [Candidatus Binatia bacterium]
MEIGDSLRQAQEHRSRSKKFIKQFFMAVITTGLLVANWWVLYQAMFGGQPTSYWIWPAVISAFWVMSVSFFALINPDRITFFTFNALGLVAYLIIMPKDPYIFFGGAIFFLLSLLFQRRIQDEEKNQLNFSIRRTLSNGLTIITTALLIMVGFLVYTNVKSDFNRNPDEFYRSLGRTAVKGVPYLTQDRSRYNLNQTVDEFFRKQAQEEYPQFNQVSASQQRLLLEQIRQNFQQQFGVNANDNDTLMVAMTEVVTQRLREALGRFERFFPLFFTVLIVALMRTFAFVFNWAVLILSWVFYKILLALKFFRIEKQTVEVEKLDI